MAINCETTGACVTCISDTCLEFDDGPVSWGVDGDLGTCSLPTYASITHSPQITEAPEHRYGGRKGTCGDFSSVCTDIRKMNWIVSAPFCASDPIERYLQQGDCWNFRHYPDCSDKAVYWELTGSITFDTDVVYDNDVNDVTLVTFTIKGTGDHNFVHGLGDLQPAECAETVTCP